MKSIWNWLRGTRAPEAVLKGVPVHARTKTYSAETGFVYQYVFRGYRATPGLEATDFIFETSQNRKERFDITIRLMDSALAICSQRVGRPILGTERYALAKMTLFQAFDGLDPGRLTSILSPDASEMEAHLQTLGRI